MILFGEKAIKNVSQTKINQYSLEDFDKFYNNKIDNKIVLDRSDINFSIYNFGQCNLITALKAYFLNKKTLSDNESLSLIPLGNIFNNSGFLLQKIEILDQNFLNNFRWKNGIYLIENVIALFLKNKKYINQDANWIYVSEHISSGIKIVAGMGEAVLFSRLIELSNNLEEEIFKTLQYLKRFDFKRNITLFSGIKNIKLPSDRINIIEVNSKNDMENRLLKFIEKNNICELFFAKEGRFIRFFSRFFKPILYGLIFICGLLITLIFIFIYQINTMEKSIENERTNKLTIKANDISNKFHAIIKSENYESIKDMLQILDRKNNPINTLINIKKFLKNNQITSKNFAFDKNGDVKILCVINQKILEKLQKQPNVKIKILNKKNDDFETLHSNQKLKVELCLRLK